MELALVLRELSKRWLLVAIGVLVAAVAAIFSVYRLDGTKLKARSLQYSSASTQLLVDTPSSVLGNSSKPFESLSQRAVVYANFMASPAVLQLIGQKVGLSGEQLYAAGPVNAAQPRVVQEPTALRRNIELTGESNPYRLSFESQVNLPTITINSQAPTTPQAVALANAAVVGLQRYIAGLQNAASTPSQSRVVIRQLGHANGGVVDGGISKALAAIVFLGVFLLWCVLVLVGVRFRENWRASALLQGGPSGAGGDPEHDHTARENGHSDVGVARDGAEQATPGPMHDERGGYVPELPPFETLLTREDEHPQLPTRSLR
jgi:hypothetical protein